MKYGLLLINIGTPEAPTKKAVKSFLKAFLSDRRVITLPAFFRYLLVYGFILPFRVQKATRAYQQIWEENGAPLLNISEALKERLQKALGSDWKVFFSMRYSSPSIESALEALKEVQSLVVLPLYPQYATSSTGSSIEKVLTLLGKQESHPHLTVIRDFFEEPWFINAQAALIEPYLSDHDFFLFSYHGIPTAHLSSLSCKGACLNHCPKDMNQNELCYRAQCQKTTEALATRLHLLPNTYAYAFQSRLGKASWIKPYTEEYLIKLRAQGVKRIAIACPSFVTDCLETLEEIGIRAKAQWQDLGGEQCTFIPSLNTSDLWISGLCDVAKSSAYAIDNT